jgi:dihydroflavonol-4-reductase
VLGHHNNLALVQGDMEAVGQFAPALAGHDVLFHGAAYFRESFASGDHWPKLQQINIDGTFALLEAAERQGVGKVIYVSSSGVVGRMPDGAPSNEATPLDTDTANLYFKSKVIVEQRLAEWLKTHALPVVLILPTWMHGPQDAAPTAAGKLVQDFLARQLPATMPGGTSVVDVRDVALAMVAATQHGKSGERYIINNEYRSLRNIADTLEKVSGVPAPRLHLPYPAALAVGWLSQTIASLQGKEALLTVTAVRTMREALTIDGSKAVRELGVVPRAFEDTLRDSVAWYRAVASQGQRSS